MAIARAIRKDHNPFAWLGLFRLGLFAFVRWTDYCCPYCQKVYRKTYFPASVFLGNGRRTCSACGKVFDDESREWPELPNGQKFRFLFPPGVLGLSGGVLLAAAIALVFASLDEDIGVALVAVILLVISTTPPLVWIAIRLPAIRRSTERYKADAGRADLQA